MTDAIKRTTVMVRDAEKAAQWYEDVLGMSRWMDTPFTLSGNQLASGRKGDQTRLVIMQAEHDEIGMIGLLQWIDPVHKCTWRQDPDTSSVYETNARWKDFCDSGRRIPPRKHVRFVAGSGDGSRTSQTLG